jgi:hypothetical protein
VWGASSGLSVTHLLSVLPRMDGDISPHLSLLVLMLWTCAISMLVIEIFWIKVRSQIWGILLLLGWNKCASFPLPCLGKGFCSRSHPVTLYVSYLEWRFMEIMVQKYSVALHARAVARPEQCIHAIHANW